MRGSTTRTLQGDILSPVDTPSAIPRTRRTYRAPVLWAKPVFLTVLPKGLVRPESGIDPASAEGTALCRLGLLAVRRHRRCPFAALEVAATRETAALPKSAIARRATADGPIAQGDFGSPCNPRPEGYSVPLGTADQSFRALDHDRCFDRRLRPKGDFGSPIGFPSTGDSASLDPRLCSARKARGGAMY